MASSSSLQHLLSLNGQEQIGYFKAGAYANLAQICSIALRVSVSVPDWQI